MKKINSKKMIKPTALALALCALACQGVGATEIGRIVVYSHLSEPLEARVVLADNVNQRQVSDFDVTIASAATYESAGVKRPVWLDAASVSIVRIDKDRFELRIKTSVPVEMPASSLILDVAVKGQEDRLVREYAIILDPVEVDPQPHSAQIPAAKPWKAPMQARADGATVVKSGQILYGIAQSKREGDVSVERMMIGILRSNPNAFVDNNINRLKAGAILRMPERPELAAIAQAEAISEVNKQAGAFGQWRSKAAGSVSEVNSKSGSSSASGKIAPAASNPEGGKDVLKLGKSEQGAKPDAMSKVDLIAKQKALDEANEKLRSLEKIKDDLQKLLTLKDQQLAAAAAAKKVEAKPEVKPEVKAEVKPEVKAEVKPEMKAEVKPEMKAEVKPEVKAEVKPEVKVEVKPETVLEAKPEVAPEVKAEVAPEAKPEIKPIPAPKPLPAPAPAPAPEPTMLESAMAMGADYGLYLGGALAALLGVGFLFKRRGRRDRMLSTTISPEIGADPKGSSDEKIDDAPSALEDRINSADTYIAFDQPDKALRELEEALKISPSNLEALIRLARIEAKRQDRGALGRIAAEIGDKSLRSGSYWDEVEAMLAKFATQEDVRPTVAPLIPERAEIDLLGMDLEQSLMDLDIDAKPVDHGKATAAGALETNASFEAPHVVANMEGDASNDHGMEMNFELPSFEVPAPQPAALGKAEEIQAAPSFESLSFDLSLPDDKPSGSLDLNSESLNFDVPAQAELPPESEAESELRTMLELAKAYMDMGDRDGSRELLVEIEQKGSPALVKQAKEMLASL